MPLEDVRTIEGLLYLSSPARAETTYNGASEVCQSVPVLVVLPTEPLDVVVTSNNWTLLGSFPRMSQHMRLQVLETLFAVWNWAFSAKLL
jgi:hypothetical protein